MGRILAIVLLLVVGLAPRPAVAAPILGGTIIVAGTDDVIATYLGEIAGFSHDLYLYSTDDNAFVPLWLFNTTDNFVDGPPFLPGAEGGPGSTPGAQVNLGSFAPGTELVFRLRVHSDDDPDYDLFTGSGGDNPDGAPKAFVDSAFACPHPYLSLNPADPVDPLCLEALGYVTALGGAQTVVGWEDLVTTFGPTPDNDYNDLVFAFSNTRAAVDEAPEPTSLLLLGLGAAGLAARRRQKKTL